MIVHVINRIVPGGAEKQLLRLVERSRLDQEIVELNPGGESPLGRLRALRRSLDARGARVVVAWLDRSQISAAAVARPGTRLVASVCGLPRRIPRREQALLRVSFTRFDRFVTNSAVVREATREFARPLPLSPFDVIPNGVDGQGERPDSTGRRRVAFIGRDTPDKGLDVFLSAAALLAPDIDVVAVGDGVPERVAASPVARRVTAIPRVDDPWSAAGALGVLAVPSRSEGSPNIVTEAFVHGVPVVGTPAGGAAELLDADRGTVVPIGDAGALAWAIEDALSDRAGSARRAAAAREYALAIHSWDRVVAAWERLLLGELDGSSRV